MPKLAPMSKYLRAETEKKGGPYGISGNLRRAVQFCKKRGQLALKVCAMASSRPKL
jgi:hypothetical protein